MEVNIKDRLNKDITVARNYYDSVDSEKSVVSDELSYRIDSDHNTLLLILKEDLANEDTVWSATMLSKGHIPALKQMLSDLESISSKN